MSPARTYQPIITPQMFGAKGDGTTDDTIAIQKALDAAGDMLPYPNGGGGTVHLPAARGAYLFTNLKIPAYVTLQGESMSHTILQRMAGATGIAIREKTIAERNSAGASGLWVRDLCIDGQGTTGDGLNLGNQDGGSLNYLAGVSNVMTRNFVGTGMDLVCNAVQCQYLWSNLNTVGIRTGGGGSGYAGIWAEANTQTDLDLGGGGDSYHHVQVETNGEQAILLRNNQMALFGVYIGLGAADTHNGLVTYLAGATRNTIWHLYVGGNAFAYNNDVYVTGDSYGTGALGIVPFFIDDGGYTSYIYNQASNIGLTIAGGAIESQPAGWATIGATRPFFQVKSSQLTGGILVPGYADLTYGATVNINAFLGGRFYLPITNGSAFTIANPTNPTTGQEITIAMKNNTAGAAGPVSWGSNFTLVNSTFMGPPAGEFRTITFYYDNPTWVEIARSPSQERGSAAPTAGTWATGDKVWNTAPEPGGNAGWVCTAGGTPGTWKPFAVIGV
jgi:hypothetical protein